MNTQATQAFSELAEVNPRVDLCSLRGDTPVSFIPMSDVSDAGQWTHQQERTLDEVRGSYTSFVEGDVLFAKITPCMENGKGAHVTGLKSGIGFGSTEFHVLRARGDNSSRFLFHWLQAPSARTRAIAFMGGSAGQQRVHAEFFSHFHVPQMDPAEQSRIAAVLDTVDEAIAKTEAVIAKLKQVRAGLLHDLLTCGLDEHGQLRDPIARPEQFMDSPLGRIPREWDVGTLVSRISLPQGQVDPRIPPYCDWVLVAPDHIESQTGRLLTKATASEQGAISGKYVFEPGDVIYSKIRPYLRKAVLARGTGLCSADMYPLRPDKGVSPRFLLAVVLGETFSRFAAAVSMRSGFPKINREELAEFVMGWPCPEEQRRIAGVLETMEREQAAIEAELSKLHQLKSGLMNDLLTGRVRVPESISAGDRQS